MCKMTESAEDTKNCRYFTFPIIEWPKLFCFSRGLCEAANFTVSCNKEQNNIKMEFDLVVRNYDSAPINPNDTRCGSNCGRSNLRQMLR